MRPAHAFRSALAFAAAVASGSTSIATHEGGAELHRRHREDPAPGADVEHACGRPRREGALQQHEAALGAAVMPGAEGPARLDHERDAGRGGGTGLPRGQHEEALTDGARGEGLLPGTRPCRVEERRDLRVVSVGKAERTERRAVSADGGQERGRGGRLGKEGTQARGLGGHFLLDHTEGALLPEEVGQSVGGLGRGGNGELPERHQVPKSFFIRSTNFDSRGPASSSDTRRNSSSNSFWRAERRVGTSTTTS